MNNTATEPNKVVLANKFCGIPDRHWENLPFDGSDRGAEWVQTKTKLTHAVAEGLTIALLGSRGTGKTQMASEVVRDAHGALLKSKYTRAMQFFLAVRSTYGAEGKTEQAVIESFVSPYLLVIDEVHDRGGSEWEDRLLTHVIDRRYGERKATVLIANQTPEAFARAMGPSVMDRIAEAGKVIVCDWASWRRERGAQA